MNERIGKFEILEFLGQGAMGEVFLGRDPVIGREVAIKTLHSTWAGTPEARERFFREAQAAGQLSHPNIVTVLEFGEDQGRLFLVMEYVPGRDLAAALADRSLSPAVILDLLAQVCDGLAAAHRKGILHRDIKPSNIRLSAEPGCLRAKIMDFGIARIQSSDLTSNNTLLGTFGYMAPEYIQTGRPGPQSDLFAVGVILYEALAGRRPFAGESTATLLYSILQESPKPPPAAHLRGISPATFALLQRALAKDPDRRFESAEDLAAALRAAKDPAWPGPGPRSGTVVTARPGPLGGRPSVRTLWILAAAVLLIGSGLALGRLARSAVHPSANVPIPAAPEPEPAQAPATATAAQEAPVLQPAAAAPAEAPAHPPEPDRTQTPPAAPPAARSVDSFNAALQSLETDPAAALDFLEKNPDAGDRPGRTTALRMVALYNLGRYEDCAELLGEARRAGTDIGRMGREFPRFGRMLAQERQEHHLPPGAIPAGPGR